jgi:hypothetical protein
MGSVHHTAGPKALYLGIRNFINDYDEDAGGVLAILDAHVFSL